MIFKAEGIPLRHPLRNSLDLVLYNIRISDHILPAWLLPARELRC